MISIWDSAELNDVDIMIVEKTRIIKAKLKKYDVKHCNLSASIGKSEKSR